MTDVADPIGAELEARCEEVHHLLLHSLAEHAGGEPIELLTLLRVGIKTAYQVGLEAGACIAVDDIVCGRRLRDWIAANIQHDEPHAIAGRDSHVRSWLAVLDRA